MHPNYSKGVLAVVRETDISPSGGVLVVGDKLSICSLLDDEPALSSLLEGLLPHGHSKPQLPSSDQLWSILDGARIDGSSRIAGPAAGVTLLSLNSFEMPRTSLNILSTGDSRVREQSHSHGSSSLYLYQCSRLSKNMSVVHEPYKFVTQSKMCRFGQTHAACGPTTNVLLTGQWLYSADGVEDFIKGAIRRYYFVSDDTLNVCSGLKMAGSPGTESTDCVCASCVSHHKVFYTVPNQRYCRLPERLRNRCQQLRYSENVSVPVEQTQITSPFATNSTFGRFVSLTVPVNENVFWKRCRFPQAEIEGSEEAVRFYSLVQRPIRAVTGELLYKYFEGTSQAEIRLLYIKGGRKDTKLRNHILHIELRKVEEVFGASVESFRHHVVEPSPRIERLYYNRALDGNRRFCDNHRQGIDFYGETVKLSDFLLAPVIVNGHLCPSFSELTQRAETMLQPSAYPQGFVFGLADCHGGNVLIENGPEQVGERDILFMDYEYAGFHPAVLDFANAFYIDVFFDILYNHITRETFEVCATFREGKVELEVDLYDDILNAAILEIKLSYLLEPLFDFMERQGLALKQQTDLLASALFMSATSKQTWPQGNDEFFARLAVGVLLSQVESTEGIRGAWRLLNRRSVACYQDF